MELLRPKAAAELVGVTDRTLRKWAAAGKLTKHTARDGSPRYDRAELESLANVEADRKGPEETGPPDRNEPEGAGSWPEGAGSWPDAAEQWRNALEREAALSHENAALRREVVELHQAAAHQAQQHAATLTEQAERLGRLEAEAAERAYLRERIQALELALNREQESVLRFTETMRALPAPEQPARPWWRWWGK